MNRKHTALAAGAALAILAAGGAVTATSFAAGNVHDSSGLAAKIATAFGLDQAKVQSTIDSYRTEEQTTRRAEMQQKISDRLTQAVTDGKITAEQKSILETKQKEFRDKMDAARALSDETARKAAFDALGTETKTFIDANPWAKDLLRGPGGPGGPGGFGRHGGNRPMMGEGMMDRPDAN